MSDVLGDLDATGLATLVRQREVQPVELVDAAIARIETLDPQLNCVIHRQFDRARAEAVGSLPDGPFRGVPFLLKDIGCEEAGEPHQEGMRALRDVGWRGRTDNPLALAFRACGLVPLGRTNVPELALMGTTEPDAFGPTRNPWDLGHSPGGSSGGSAAAVAAGLVPAAHANDIAGSIRIPSAHCGLVGLKPTRGRVLAGRAADPAVGMNTEGVVTRTVRDTAALVDAVTDRVSTGPWPAPPLPRPLLDELGHDPRGLRIGLCTTAFSGVEVEPTCRQAAVDTAEVLASLGHPVDEAAPAALFDDELRAVSRTLLAVTAAGHVDRVSAQLGRTLGEGDVEPLTWQMVAEGRVIGGAAVLHAIDRQHEIARQALAWWRGPDRDGFDVLLTPTCAEPPPPLGAYKSGYVPGRASAFTRVFNATGQPAISLPLVWPGDGLPRGVQLVGAYGREDVLIRLAAQLEQAVPWAQRRPVASDRSGSGGEARQETLAQRETLR